MATQAVTADDRDWRTGMARVGLVAKGVLYLVLGVLALRLAFGDGGSQASQTGAIQTLEGQPMGSLLVGLMAVGLLAHGAWQALLVFTGDPVEGDDAKLRVKFFVKAVIYLGLGVAAVRVLMGSGSSGGDSSDQAASTLLGLPGGVWLVAVLGLVVVGVGVSEWLRHAVGASFMERINRTGHGHVRRNVERAGRAGYAALGTVTIVTGGFFLVAAVQHDPDKSRGMNGSLQALADQPWGPWILTGVAVGVVLYGVFCLAEARYRRAG